MRGDHIKDFVLVDPLGRGGMGEVWAGEQQIIKTRVAIKLLREDISADAGQVQRFFNEAIAVSKVKHSGIVKIFDVGFHRGRAFLIMELLEGESLTTRIRRLGRLPLRQLADIGSQTASVLDATHAAGITHRDLKPDNIFIVDDHERESGERVRVLDFGIAKLTEHGATGVTASSGTMGTPAYMAPEQWRSAASADARADVYSLGCALFEMACGRPPFPAATVGEACTMHLHDIPPRARTLAPQLPKAVDDLIARMLEKQPDERPTMTEIGDVLDANPVGAPVVLERTLAGYGESNAAAMAATSGAVASSARSAKSAAAAIGEAQTIGPGAGIAVAETLDTMVPAATAQGGAATVDTRMPASSDVPAPSVIPAQLSSRPASHTTLGTAASAMLVPPESARPRRRLVWLGAGAAIVGLGAGFYALRGDRASKPRTAAAATETKPAPKLVQPVLGERTITNYIVSPTPATSGAQRSTQLWSTALHDFEEALAQPGAPPRWSASREITRGELALVEGDGAAALAAYQRAAEADPTWEVPYFGISIAQSARRNREAALIAASRAQRIAPTWWRAALATGRAYSATHALDDAILAYRVALELAKDSPLLLAEMALLYHASHLDEQATETADRAIALAKDDARSLIQISLLRAERALEAGNAAVALQQTAEALSVAPKHGAIHLARGDAFALQGKKDAAFAEYNQALSPHAANAGAPDGRIVLVKRALKSGKLPPPRTPSTEHGPTADKPSTRSRPYTAGMDIDLVAP